MAVPHHTPLPWIPAFAGMTGRKGAFHRILVNPCSLLHNLAGRCGRPYPWTAPRFLPRRARVSAVDSWANASNIYDHLEPTEKLICSFGPFHATSYRVLRLDPENGPSRGHLLEIPYPQLASVKLMQQPNHPILIMGTVVIILGLLLTPILVFSSVFALLVGGLFIFVGARGKPGYFQIYAHDMPQQAERYWQVQYERSGSFIATVRNVIGDMPDF